MTEPDPTPQAKIKQGRRFGFSFIWLAPVIAAAVGGLLFYKSEIDVGPTLTIIFENGARISNSAKVIYRGVQVGAVQSVVLDPSLGHVNVTVQLDKTARDLAREGSQFWLVEPRVSIDKISGLSIRSVVLSDKANSPLVIDPNAVLPLAVASQPFQSIAREARQYHV